MDDFYDVLKADMDTVEIGNPEGSTVTGANLAERKMMKGTVCLLYTSTANVIAKLAQGLADDMLTTTFLACSCTKIICPAMNTGMLENPATQENLRLLKARGMRIVEADSGLLACGDVGKGRLAPLDVIEDEIEQALITEKPLAGLKVLVSAGPTQEALDPVRYLTNHSSGKMGYAIAKAARNWGAKVTLVHGPTALPALRGVEAVSYTHLDVYKRQLQT